MNNKRNSRPAIIWSFALIFVGALLASQCNGSRPPVAEVPPPKITQLVVSGSPEKLMPGEDVFVFADLTVASTKIPVVYTWNAKNGTITIGQGTDTILYKAPGKPGTYEVSLKIEQGGQGAEKSVSITVVSPTPTPTNTPMPTNTPTPTDIPTPTDTPTPTYTPEQTGTSTETVVSTYTPTQTPTHIPTPSSTPTPTKTPLPTDTPTPRPTPATYPTVIPGNVEDKDNAQFKVLHWQWPGKPDTIGDDWFFVIKFLRKEDPLLGQILPPRIMPVPTEGKEFVYWFNIYDLPERSSACDPYWMVAVARPSDRNLPCAPGYDEGEICRLTEYSKPKLLGGRHPGAKCDGGDTGSSSGSGSTPGSGTAPRP